MNQLFITGGISIIYYISGMNDSKIYTFLIVPFQQLNNFALFYNKYSIPDLKYLIPENPAYIPGF